MTKVTLMVCPHDTARGPEGWYRMAQYLTQHLEFDVHFELSLDVNDFREQLDSADIVYANPLDTLRLIDQRGFILQVKPKDLYDELVFVASTDIANPTLEALQGEKIATVRNLLPSNIALYLLKQRSIEPAELLDRESWMSVIRSVWQGEANYGIVYKDTYDGLSDQGKSMVNTFFTSDEKVAFHSFVCNPNVEIKCDNLQNALLAMDSDDTGKEVLSELHRIASWTRITEEEFNLMRHIVKEYS